MEAIEICMLICICSYEYEEFGIDKWERVITYNIKILKEVADTGETECILQSYS